MNAIETKNLTKKFGDLTAVDGLNLSVRKGELFGLIGSDGAGKTTVMRMLAGVMKPTSGEAQLLGRDVVQDPEGVKGDTGYMSQRFGLYPDLTVLENINFYADIFSQPRHGRDKVIDRLLAFSNLGPFVNRKAGQLSGGMKQKLGLACALIHTPAILLLDEPTNGVDPVSRRDFWRILHRLLSEGVTIFLSTAYLDEADRCTRVGLIHGGSLMACDTPQNLKGLMRGATLEVRTRNPRRAVAVLKEKLELHSVALFGDRLHLVTDDPDGTQMRITAICAEAGIVVDEMRKVPPSMEDVFVSVLQSESGAGSPVKAAAI
jgi:ABC-2 type transport system ATP-binding protein